MPAQHKGGFWDIFRKYYVESEEIKNTYGDWKAPDDKVALNKYHHEHTHHQQYDVKDARTKDLKLFGQGHMLYFYFLKYMAIIFGILAILPAMPLIIANLAGGWFYTRADLETSTLGQFGLLWSSNTSEYLYDMLAQNQDVWSSAKGLSGQPLNISGYGVSKSIDMELATALLFMSHANQTNATNSLGWSKGPTSTTMSILDLL
eukprot:CAMPEP_0202909134 /NCGR_PEP_ID=MMETSP1392-20130828/48431_1 /ASSEMBLY_ACC=CAM_ASM_000868 /TAXON_ID=225041 /ORGANISM="Chlamydomonas chlamydogama, Strain SAG 11-48b" /LENGTH=203 /DNA_ID=CAMNT_0049598783 /DNA_START=44 /DNA_END=652 /DNA_ORIENTATION=+